MASKIKYHQLNDLDRRKCFSDFYYMITLLKGSDEIVNFLKDILTPSEVVMISRRIQIAKRLIRGDTYDDIINNLKVGKTTINKVDRWLNNGFNGYKNAIKKYNKAKEGRQKKELAYNENIHGTFTNLRKKYPAHFLLFNMFLDDK